MASLGADLMSTTSTLTAAPASTPSLPRPRIVRLSELEDGQDAECFAALVKKDNGTDKHGNPYIKCHFRDRAGVLVAPLWSSHPCLEAARNWPIGEGYRLLARAKRDARYGLQLELSNARLATPEDVADGYNFFDLVESSKYSPDSRFDRILGFIDQQVSCPQIRRLLLAILQENAELFKKMPAATSMHHGFNGGLIEHVWSVTRVSILLVKHYAAYYNHLNPPLNPDVVVAAAILHDIGKLRELAYHPVEAKYTKHGTLIGHIVLGRDMIRDKAREMGDFPEETLLLLEHAVLAHHGQMQYGAPKEPSTIEAMIVHYADEIDAKINAVAAERTRCDGAEGEFTGKVYAVGNRMFYKGIPVEAAANPDDDLDEVG